MTEDDNHCQLWPGKGSEHIVDGVDSPTQNHCFRKSGTIYLLAVEKTHTDQNCNVGHWLNIFPDSPEKCAKMVLDNVRCDNTYFSYADGNDNNCWCVDRGTDCPNHLS